MTHGHDHSRRRDDTPKGRRSSRDSTRTTSKSKTRPRTSGTHVKEEGDQTLAKKGGDQEEVLRVEGDKGSNDVSPSESTSEAEDNAGEGEGLLAGDSPEREQEGSQASPENGVEDSTVEAEEFGEIEEIKPEDFNSQNFQSNVSDLSRQLKSESFSKIEEDSFPAQELKLMVNNYTTTMENFRNYSVFSQMQMEEVRIQMRDIKDKIFRRIQSKGFDTNTTAYERKTAEERALDARLAALHQDMAHVAEELTRATQFSTETECACVQAGLMAEQAAEDARRVQSEYEARKLAEVEARAAEEAARAQEAAALEDAVRREVEAARAEEARRGRLRRTDDTHGPAWDDWPVLTYHVPPGGHDQGVGCVVRGNPQTFRENMAACQVIHPLNAHFRFEDSEELVSNVVHLKQSYGDEIIQDFILVALPYYVARGQNINREPVIKAEVSPGQWEELPSQEVTLDSHKDLNLKFVQAEVRDFCKLAVVTRMKRDFLQISKRGGKVTSSLDPRLTFSAERGTFRKTEHFVAQLQTVDSGTVADVKTRTAAGKGLLSSSAVISMEWMATDFARPVTVTLPVPPNPVKAKKAAAARAAKEARMKNPHAPPPVEEPKKDDRKKKDHSKSRGARGSQAELEGEEDAVVQKVGVTKWYMGQYGTNDDDENDLLFLLRQNENGRWLVADLNDETILQLKLDLVQFELVEPLNRFMVLRTRTNVNERAAQTLADTISMHLNRRAVHVLVRQKPDDMCEVHLQLVPHQKGVERALRRLQEKGYEDGPRDTKEITLHEGDNLVVGFRGNIKCEEQEVPLSLCFNSQLDNHIQFSVIEVDKYLQKSYNVFRGFVQLFRRTRVDESAGPDNEADDDAAGAGNWEDELLCEQVISIPKAVDPQNRAVVKAPVVLRNSEDVVNEDMLRSVAQALGDEWQHVAHFLNVKSVRIQAILRNNQHKDDGGEDAKYEMLITWLKKVPRSANKVEMLCQALTFSGRGDIAGNLERIDEERHPHRKKANAHARNARRPRGSARSMRNMRSGGRGRQTLVY